MSWFLEVATMRWKRRVTSNEPRRRVYRWKADVSLLWNLLVLSSLAVFEEFSFKNSKYNMKHPKIVVGHAILWWTVCRIIDILKISGSSWRTFWKHLREKKELCKEIIVLFYNFAQKISIPVVNVVCMGRCERTSLPLPISTDIARPLCVVIPFVRLGCCRAT